MTNHALRLACASVATTAVVASIAAIAVPAEAATTPAPSTPLSRAANWSAAQLTDGIVHDQQYDYDDVGGSINVAYDLKLTGGHASEIPTIVSAVGSRLVGTQTNGVSGYIQSAEYASTSPYGFVQIGYYANAAANALVFAQAMGKNPKAYGGANLVAAVQNRIAKTSGATAGQIADDSSYGNYANSIGQALAAHGLATAKSPKAGAALAFLLKQQCTAGYFRLYAAAGSGGSWTCNSGVASGKSPADTDTTSLVMQQLEPMAKDNATVAAALAKAKAWLAKQQHADGSFGGGPSTPAPNSNSTGLAGSVLGDLGDSTAARKAAIWVRQHQAQEIAQCADKLSNQTGAIAYDGTALTTGRRNGITTTVAGQWRSATFQALPVLKWAPTTGGTLKATATTGYVKAGTRTKITVSGLVPGSLVCVAPGSAKVRAVAGLGGNATATVPLPQSTTNWVVSVTTGARVAKTTLKVLGAKTLGLRLSTLSPHKGKSFVVTVRGLAPRENLTITYLGKAIRRVKASATGTYTTAVLNVGALGKHTLSATGQFANRHASTTVTVVR